MKKRSLGILLISAVAISAPVPAPSPDTCGQVFDATTGSPIAGVDISTHCTGASDKESERRSAMTDSLGRYCFWRLGGDKLVYTAVGYHTLHLCYPEDLSPSGEIENCPEDFNDVFLVPRELP